MKMLGEILAKTASTKGCQPAAQQQAADWKQARAAPVRPPTRARPVLDSRGCAPIRRATLKRPQFECLRAPFMATFRKTETGKQNQQRAIGNRPAIITRRGFAAKRIF